MQEVDEHIGLKILMASPDIGSFVYDFQHKKFLSFDKGFLGLLGCEEEIRPDAINEIFNSRINPQDIEDFNATYLLHKIHQNKIFYSIFRISQAVSSYRWLMIATVSCPSNGQGFAIQGLAMDISELLLLSKFKIAMLEARNETYKELLGKLSNRETEVFGLFVNGKTYVEIAEILCISPHTVIKHKKNIFRKTGTKNIKQLICLAYETGIK
jgi:DNA-binding CsgD family transcriptional regulator